VKRPCPQLPPLIQGSIHVQGSEGSGLGLEPPRAVYQCWFGLVLEPAESEVRYCIQGKWTGENPQCGKPFSIFQKNHVSITIKASSPAALHPREVVTVWTLWLIKILTVSAPVPLVAFVKRYISLPTVRAGCGRPATIAHGYYTSSGMINHVHPTSSSLKCHCDSGYQLNGPAVFTCWGQGVDTKLMIPVQR